MKKFGIFFIFFCWVLTNSISDCFSQIPLDLKGSIKNRITTLTNEKLEPQSEIEIIEIGSSTDGTSLYYYVVSDGQKLQIKYRDLKDIDIKYPKTLSELWSTVLLTDTEVYNNLLKNGMNYDIRSDADEESIKFLEKYDEYDLFFNDIFLQEYLQSLLPSIHPITLNDNRPGNLSIKVIINNYPNAFCLPNGTILISTGMLSLIDSEKELIAVIAHEVAHFVLDHYVNNIIAEIKRQQRAEFWAGFATMVAAVGDAYLASQNQYHTFGVITAGAAIISSSLANGITKRLGLKYSREQEEEADKVATLVLKLLNISPDALATVFEKLKNYSISIGDYYAFSSNGTHPSLSKRIHSIGNPRPNDFVEQSYYTVISNVNTTNAYIELYNQHYKDADRIVSRNITSNIATEDDYILKSRLLRNLYNDKDNMEKALEFLIKAEKLNVVPRRTIFKDKGLTFIRLKRTEDARTSFEAYLESLEEIEDKDYWYYEEIEWTKKMIFKCRQF